VFPNLILVLFHSGFLLQLAAKLLSAFFKLICNVQDLSLSLLQAMLVGDTFELVSLLDKACVLKLDCSLLIHDLRDFIAHHFSHLLADVIL